MKYAKNLLSFCCLIGAAQPVLAITAGDGKLNKPLPSDQTQQDSNQPAESSSSGYFFDRPYIDGSLSFRFFTDQNYNSDNPNNRGTDTWMRASLDSNIYLSKELNIDFNARVTTSQGMQSRDNYVIDKAAFEITDLALIYDTEDWWVSGGRGPVNFSMARKMAAGMWGGATVNSELGIRNKAGLSSGGRLNFGSYGRHALYASLFMADNSFINTNWGISSKSYPLSDGGPSNTGKLNSFAFALDGSRFAALPKFRYHLGAAQLDTQSIQVKGLQVPTQFLANEQRYAVAGVFDKLDVGWNIKFTPLLEYDRVNNSKGISGYSRNYYTASGLFGWNQWNLGGSYISWNQNWPTTALDDANVPTSNSATVPTYKYGYASNYSAQIGGGYLFKNGLAINVGVKRNSIMNVRTDTVGIALQYNLPFSF